MKMHTFIFVLTSCIFIHTALGEPIPLCNIYDFKTSNPSSSGKCYLICKFIGKQEKKDIFDLNILDGLTPSKMHFTPDTTYYVSFRIKATGKFIFCFRYIEWERLNVKPKWNASFLLRKLKSITTADWKKYEFVFTTSKNIMEALPIIGINSTPNAKVNDIIFIDEIKVILFEKKFPGVLPVDVNLTP